MACKESRAIIENHFTIPKWTIRQCKDQSIDDAGDYSVSFEDCAWSKRALPLRIGPVEKGIALPDGKSLDVSKPDYFWGSPLPQLTTSQQRDVFVLQAWSLREVDWNHLSFDFGFGPCTLRPRYGLNNIGVVYNSTWWHKKNEDWKPHVIEILSRYSSEARLNPVDMLWIVDHGLKRNEDAPTIEEMSAKSEFPYRTFYTSDRKLVEVNDWNMEHFTFYYPETLDKEGQPLQDCSIDLAWCLSNTYGRPVSVLGWDDLDS